MKTPVIDHSSTGLLVLIILTIAFIAAQAAANYADQQRPVAEQSIELHSDIPDDAPAQ